MRIGFLLICHLLCLTVLAQVRSVRSGNWSDAATWGGKIPANTDKALIDNDHTVLYDLELTTVNGIEVNGTLQFDPNKTVTLQSSKNVHV